MMHFVAETVERGFPESLNLLEDLDAVEKNERYSLGDLEKDLKDLRALVNKVALEIEKGSGSPNVPEEISAPFNERLKPFVESTQALLSDLDNRMATVITKSKEVVKALAFNAENEDDALQELFKLLTTFAKKFKEAHLQNVNAREKKARDERIRLANEKNKKSFRKKKPSAETPLKPAAPKNKDLFAQFSASRTGDAASIILQTRMQNMQSSNAGLDALRSDDEDD
uniref:FH2 domain-containing protein n=1 Tax=Octactis speculum TaxID=3111310 RepID=A0A7S2MFZ4_9STRA